MDAATLCPPRLNTPSAKRRCANGFFLSDFFALFFHCFCLLRVQQVDAATMSKKDSKRFKRLKSKKGSSLSLDPCVSLLFPFTSQFNVDVVSGWQDYDFLRTANIKPLTAKGYSLVPALLSQVHSSLFSYFSFSFSSLPSLDSPGCCHCE